MTLACDMGGNYRSTDHGITWHMMDFGLQCRAGGPVSYDPTNPKVLFSVGYRTIWKSVDSGKTWKGVASIEGIGCSDIVVDPKLPKHVWAAMTKQAVTPVFVSMDGGATWKESGQGIPDKTEVRGLHLDLTSAPGKRRLFAAANTGFYISSDNGSTWTTSLAHGVISDMTGCSTPAGWSPFCSSQGERGLPVRHCRRTLGFCGERSSRRWSVLQASGNATKRQ